MGEERCIGEIDVGMPGTRYVLACRPGKLAPPGMQGQSV